MFTTRNAPREVNSAGGIWPAVCGLLLHLPGALSESLARACLAAAPRAVMCYWRFEGACDASTVLDRTHTSMSAAVRNTHTSSQLCRSRTLTSYVRERGGSRSRAAARGRPF